MADCIALMIDVIKSSDSRIIKYQQSVNEILVIFELGFVGYVNSRRSTLVYIINIIVGLLVAYNNLSQSNAIYNLVISYLSLSIVVIANSTVLTIKKFYNYESAQTQSNFSTSGPTYVKDFEEYITRMKPQKLERCRIRDKCEFRSRVLLK